MTIRSIPDREVVPLASLRPHPRNYRGHPDAQLDHIAQSIRANGVYRNVVVARDGTILAGHGVVLAARMAGLDSIPVVRLDLDPEDVRALKVLAGDNESARLAEDDDRRLAELLRQVRDEDESGLLGTGFDDVALGELLDAVRADGESGPTDPAGDRPSLADRFGVPPFSVLDARQGYWQDRKRAWIALGIRSEIGRGG